MKNKLFLLGVLVLLFTSCEKNVNNYNGSSVHFGMSEYYAPFLGVKSDTVTIEKTLKYEFNQFAKDERSYVNMSFVDAEQQLIDNKNIQFFVDGVLVSNNSFKINFDDLGIGEKKIGIRFLPGYKQDYTSGFLVITNHSLDVINNNDLVNSYESRIFKWEAAYDVSMNPLKKGLLWTVFIIVTGLLIWFVFMRNIMFPKMKRGQIVINSPFYTSIKIKRARKIVFTTQRKRQKRLDKIFVGNIIYEVNSIWKEEIIIYPDRQKSLRIKMGLGYTITPFTSSLKQGSSYQIKKESEIINLSYL